MKTTIGFLTVGYVLGILGHDPSRVSVEQISQRFVCERSYTNFAWGYQHGGIFVDHDGGVYRFAVRGTSRLAPASTDGLDEAELEAKFGPDRTLLRTVSKDELLAMFRLIPAAAKGRNSERVSVSRDRGALVSACYSFDAKKRRYRLIELDVKGDWEYRNLAPEAHKLAEWLATLDRPLQEKK
jgi:hypothetical protein